MDSSPSTSHSETTANTMSHTSNNSRNFDKINQNRLECSYLVVGGGIAGVSCAETIKFLAPDKKIIILSESSLIKSVSNLVQLGKFAQRFDVSEVAASSLETENVKVVTDQLKAIESSRKEVQTASGSVIRYEILCICTGARPTLIQGIEDFTIGIRDTDSVREFQKRIKNGQKFVLVGNGGIASEIAFEIRNIEIDWVVKDGHISSTFIDAGAAKFFESRLQNKNENEPQTLVKRMRYSEESAETSRGAALGPDWHRLIDMTGNSSDNVRVHYGVEVSAVTRTEGDKHPIVVELTNGLRIPTDFIVSATGVRPFVNFSCDFVTGDDGGIVVDELMKTSVDCVFAAGDVCSAGWEPAECWHQMKLWTQARQMGMMAGKSMVAHHRGEQIYQEFCFELFSHVTKLYGYQVVLLGKFNGQGLEGDHELLFRVTPNLEYIKFVLKEGRLVGALLIGETSLEETCENLILNRIDLTPFGDDILNPNIDIEDFFD
jgi:pyridine nucleotide-disulfide oxidoreductase domain-containing protein 1